MDLLPVEIWCSIFRLLDPVGLVAASQACAKFRQIVQPGRVHFVERLLALECQAEHGGPVPRFHANNYELEPAWEDEAWTRMRWACSGCLRLLPDAAFDNHSLLRLGYRKPAPGTPSSRAVTSWEASANLVRNRQWTAEDRERLRAQEKRLRRQYGIALSWNWDIPKDSQDPLQRLLSFQDAGLREFVHCRLEYFQCMDIEEERDMFDRAAAAIEGERTGFRRRLRRCNECRWRRGEMRVRWLRSVNEQGLRLSGPNIGTANVPIVRSRQVLLPSPLDRWFPGWSSVLLGEGDGEAKPPKTGGPLHFRIYNKLRQHEPWTLYMVRCRGCARWQELRAFRCGDAFPKWRPVSRSQAMEQYENWDGERLTDGYLDKLVCNRCYRERHGDERLARDLMLWWGVLADSEMRRLEFDMSYGWRMLERHAPGLLLHDDDEDAATADGSGGTAAATAIPMCRSTGTVQFELVKDRAALRRRQKRFADLLYGPDDADFPASSSSGDKDTRGLARQQMTTIKRALEEDETMRAWMGYWAREYGTMDDWWFWLRRCKEAFRADPKLLLMEDRDFVAGVIRRGAELERPMEWWPVSAWDASGPWQASIPCRLRT
ncbi:hypothetical protein PG991_010413 [Apiospora marii]|uniref:F-box domain-containing protein n=1 Tax=Apiospora marii TaxID=335849 RepID=A0ABR1RIM1_9PEZI